jgi:hypothetical protein
MGIKKLLGRFLTLPYRPLNTHAVELFTSGQTCLTYSQPPQSILCWILSPFPAFRSENMLRSEKKNSDHVQAGSVAVTDQDSLRYADDVLLARLGYKAEFKREFSVKTCLYFK